MKKKTGVRRLPVKDDIVEIKGNIDLRLKNRTRPIKGRVTNVNGYYIFVRPFHCKWVGEWYPNELKIVN